MFIDKYFDSKIHSQSFLREPLPLGVLREYVHRSMLDGLINYINWQENPVFILMNRYIGWNENKGFETLEVPEYYKESIDEATSVVMAGGRNVKCSFSTKLSRYLAYQRHHTIFPNMDLGWFGDDVMVLARVPMTEDEWIFFWFDTDPDECFVGRFRTDVPGELLRGEFEMWAEIRGLELADDHQEGTDIHPGCRILRAPKGRVHFG
jgi:hypothetical protein